MGRPRIYILLMGLVVCIAKTNAQQTIQFSQYVFNGLAVNPAYAGYKDDWTLNLSDRIQWVGFPGAPETGVISIDGPASADNENVGLGLIATFDHLGPESTSSIYANYAYRLRLDELDTKRLCFGIGFGVEQYSLNGAEFNPSKPGDASVPAGMESKVTPDFRFGVYYYSPNVYFGASVFNLLAQALNNIEGNTPLIKADRTLYLTGGTMIPIAEQLYLKPSIMIKEDFLGPTNIDLTGYIAFNKKIWLGVSYSTGVTAFNKTNLQSDLDNEDALTAIVEFYINDNFRVGYSYDFTVSKLASYQSGSHEISLSLSFPHKKPRIISPRYF
jgi:type IX secretion system PorP/SprF family membrane protein